jgi:RHS repeat-associated protein
MHKWFHGMTICRLERRYRTAAGGRSGNGFGAGSNVNQMFTGKERDGENTPSLDYFGARYYGAALGRFTSPDPTGLGFADPSNPQSLHLYQYVLNNPLRFVDHDGLFCYQVSKSIVSIDNAAQSASDCAKGATWVDGVATDYWYGSDGVLQVGYSLAGCGKKVR